MNIRLVVLYCNEPRKPPAATTQSLTTIRRGDLIEALRRLAKLHYNSAPQAAKQGLLIMPIPHPDASITPVQVAIHF
jgi:hypothetical protein